MCWVTPATRRRKRRRIPAAKHHGKPVSCRDIARRRLPRLPAATTARGVARRYIAHRLAGSRSVQSTQLFARGNRPRGRPPRGRSSARRAWLSDQWRTAHCTASARLTMYVAAVPKDATAFRPFRDGNRSTFYWGSQGMGCALTGQGSEAQLRSMAIDVCSAQWGPLRSLALGDGLNP